jgi:hypothetical protein
MEATAIEGVLASSVLVRVISREDAAVVAELCRQLGYEVSPDMVAEQVGSLSSRSGSQVAFVACVGTDVVGWIEAAITHHLQSPLIR